MKTILDCALVAFIAVFVCGTFGCAANEAGRTGDHERFHFTYQGDAPADVNRDMETVVELGENIRTGTDPQGRPRDVSRVEVRMLAHVIRDEEIEFPARRWAAGYAGMIWQTSPHVTKEEAMWLKDAVMDVRMHDADERMVRVAQWVLENEMDGLH